MKTRTLLKSLLAVGIVTSIASSHAAELRVNGFASVVGGRTISDSKAASSPILAPGVLDINSTYIVNPPFSGDLDNSSYDDDFSFKPETNMGLQLSADLGSNLKFTAQITSQGANDFDAEVEWLYLSYDVNDSFNVKGGRQRVPFYFYSDYLDVGYAYHWIRPPQDVYNISWSTYEGVSATYSGSVDLWDTSIQTYYGALDTDTGPFSQLDMTDLWGIVVSGSNDWLELRASYHRMDIEAPDITADVPTRPFAPGEEEYFDYLSFGAKANFGNVFVGTEYALAGLGEPAALNPDNETGFQDSIDWYITAGYRMGVWTPHITFSSTETERQSKDFDGDGTVNASSVDGDDAGRDTITLGVRYDFHPSAALKFEYTDSSEESDSSIKAINGEPGEVSTFAVGVDVIF